MANVPIIGGRSPFTFDQMRKAQQLGRKFFGDRFNVFCEGGLWYFGEFIDGRGPVSSRGRDAMRPALRPTKIYAVAPTLDEALATMEGRRAIYSIGGARPGGPGTGYRLVVDKYGRIRGFRTPAGIFSKTFPGDGN